MRSVCPLSAMLVSSSSLLLLMGVFFCVEALQSMLCLFAVCVASVPGTMMLYGNGDGRLHSHLCPPMTDC